MPDFPLLFSPLALGPLQLRSRVVMTAMTTGFGFERGVANAAMADYLRARSGGVGLATVAFGAVAAEGRVEEQLPWMWRPETAPGLERLAAAIHDGGALASLQLGHGGRQVSPRVTGSPPVAPSPVPPPVHVSEPPRELSTAEVEDIVGAFADAAAMAGASGFDAVEIHSGHGYLPHQFLSATANLRTDRYGGATVTERARFVTELVTAVRGAAPGLALLVRLNGGDLMPGGLTPADAAEAARAVEAAGADGLLMSAGVYGSVPYTIPLLDDSEAPYAELAGHVRAQVGIPVIAVGGFSRPAVAEAALARGACDGVAVGRALLADPEWVEKARDGRAAEIRPCIGAVDPCAGMLQFGEPISCAVNPEVGRESRGAPPAPGRAARVVVVGAGAGGLEAACRASEQGHHVILLEREPAVGGALVLAARTPPLRAVARLVGWYERRLAHGGVDVRTGAEADAAAILALEPSLVVLAAGARVDPPVLDGYELLATWSLEDLLAGRASSLDTTATPARPLVFGDDRAALAGVLFCAARGVQATLLSRDRSGHDASGLVRRGYHARLARAGVPRLRGIPLRLTADAVVWTDGEAEHETPADGFVLADRRRPEAVPQLDGLDAQVVRVGDAREPRDWTAAIAEGREAVDAFTRAAG